MTFKPGDVCVIINSYRHPESIGLECTIVSCSPVILDAHDQPVDVTIHIPGVPCPGSQDGSWLANSLHLRRKSPKEKTSTWDAVEKICGWSPVNAWQRLDMFQRAAVLMSLRKP